MRIYTGKHGAGRDRDYHAIKKWLDENNITIRQLADKANGPKGPPLSHSLASQTIRGIVNNRKILWQLVAVGCPVEIINLPKDMLRSINASH